MKKLIKIFTLVALAGMIFSCAKDVAPVDNQLQSSPELKGAKVKCVTLQGGTIKYSSGHYLAGESISMGYDAYGYNYQAHMFSGDYVNVYFGGAGFPPYTGNDVTYLAANPTVVSHWAWPYRGTNVIMKWNDAWLSNKDCNGDGKLDRPTDNGGTYIGSGAWETNHMSGSYEVDGKPCHWTDFYKIIAVPADATLNAGVWYAKDGTEIGSDIWGAFAIIQEIYNDPCAGFHGKQYISPDHAGLGGW